MGYEYNEVIAMLEYIGDEYKEDKYYRMARQVEEVYAKAKAFNEIEQLYIDSTTPENFAWECARIFNKHFDELESK